MKVGVIGSRSFQDFYRMVAELDALDLSVADVIVSGGCPKGADYLAERYARFRGHQLKILHADWKKLGRGAGLIRNRTLVEYCDFVVVFWDGVSRGTADVIARCLEKGKAFSLIFFKEGEICYKRVPLTK
jgi:hypothetical protein